MPWIQHKSERIELGLGANWRQFALLIVVKAFVGAMVGLRHTVMPLVAEEAFGLVSRAAVLWFIVSFGVLKAATNLFAGRMSDRDVIITKSGLIAYRLSVRAERHEIGWCLLGGFIGGPGYAQWRE